MRIEGYSSAQIETLEARLAPLKVTTTSNRSVLGSLNDYVSLLKHMVAYDGGYNAADLDHVVHRLNRTPQVRHEFHNPLEAMGNWVGSPAVEHLQGPVD